MRGDRVDLALVPIGGHYTMDRYYAVTAVEFINPQQRHPCHYNTFPLIESDAEAFKSDVQNAGFSEVIGLKPGGSHTVKRRCIVLIEAERAAIENLGGLLADIEGVAEAYSVTGEWDFVAMLRVREPEEVAEVVTHRFAVSTVSRRTHTMVAFEVFLAARPRGAVPDRQLMRASSPCSPSPALSRAAVTTS